VRAYCAPMARSPVVLVPAIFALVFSLLGIAYVRVGSLLNVTLTVRLVGREVSRRVNVSPLLRLEPGAEIDVAYDPGDPARFEPLLATAGSPAAQPAPRG
jgi:hypothetical protein